jgi:MFS family permease
MAEMYAWDMGTQGWVLSSFACGYILTNFIGGLLAFSFGGERILLFAVGVWSVCTLMTPVVASMPVQCIIALRVVLGLSEGMGLPSIIHMLSQSVGGKSSNFGLMIASGQAGYLVAQFLVPQLPWRLAFVLFGAGGVAWAVIFAFKFVLKQKHVLPSSAATSSKAPHQSSSKPPHQSTHGHPGITVELMANLACCRPLWAILIAHFSQNWLNWLAMSWGPTYLVEVLSTLPHCRIRIVHEYLPSYDI